MLGDLEQGALADSYNDAVGTVGDVTGAARPPFYVAGFNANATVFTQRLGVMTCPSDQAKVFKINPY